MRPYILAETNWKRLKKERFDLAILPWGATEAHNYHLPYGTDVYEADYIAAESARKAWDKGAKIVVLPTIPFGVNTGQSDIYLDINLNPSTQLAILDNIIEVLDRQELKRLLILNSHGGNDFKPMLRELGLKYPNMLLCMSNWFQSLNKSDYFEKEGDHADEMETSLIMHMRPDLVLPNEDWGSGAQRRNKVEAINEGWVWTERKWSQATIDTGVGDPSASTTEKGKRYFDDVTSKYGDMLVELSMADPKDLYHK